MAAAPLIALFDAECNLCVRGSAMLRRMAARGAVECVPLQDERARVRFAMVTPEAARAELHLVSAQTGEVWRGAGAIVRAMNTRRMCRLVTWPYFVPGARWLIDRAYGAIARNRYRLMGRAVLGEPGCENGACAVSPGNAARRDAS